MHNKHGNIHESAGVQHVHYDKQALLNDYKMTFRFFIGGLMFAVVAAVAYFFALAVYMGGWGHTRAEPFVTEFGDRAMPVYKGLKLPLFGGPAKPAEPEHIPPVAPVAGVPTAHEETK